MKTIEEPVVRVSDRDETITTHPAFGQIGASRVSGSTCLYGSDFTHNHYMTITIRRSEQHRNYSRDWEFGRNELIEVSLSEAQWATFISTPNVGSGVPCTIEHIEGKSVPGLPKPVPEDDKFREEIVASMAELKEALQTLASGIDGALSKTKAADLQKRMGWLADRIGSNVGFVAKQFDEHIERKIETAKIEVNAYATNMIHRTGIAALSGGVPVIEYSADNKTIDME